MKNNNIPPKQKQSASPISYICMKPKCTCTVHMIVCTAANCHDRETGSSVRLCPLYY